MPEYLVKTVNYTAKIKGNDELCHLARVGTLQKDMLVREEPGGRWTEAKNIAVLMKFWGIEPVKQSPRSIPSPEDAGTGISKISIEDSPPLQSTYIDDVNLAERQAVQNKMAPKIPRLQTVIDYNPLFSDDLKTLEDDAEVTQYIRRSSADHVSLEAMQAVDMSLARSGHSALVSSSDYQVVNANAFMVEDEGLTKSSVEDWLSSASYVKVSPPSPRASAPFFDALEDFGAEATQPSLMDAERPHEELDEREPVVSLTPEEIVENSVRGPTDAKLSADPEANLASHAVAQAVADAELEEEVLRAFELSEIAESRAYYDDVAELEAHAKYEPIEEHKFEEDSELNSATHEIFKNTHRIRREVHDGPLDDVASRQQSSRNFDVFLDEGDSEAFKVHSRSELDALMQAELDEMTRKKKAKRHAQREMPEHGRQAFEEEESSDRFKIRSRAELNQLFKEDSNDEDEDSISINMPLPSSMPNPSNLRTLFEEENELHIYLASEIHEKELEFEAQEKRGAENGCAVQAKPTEPKKSVVLNPNSKTPIKGKDEATKLNPLDRSETSLSGHDADFSNLLLEGEREIASFQNLCLTNERLWTIEIVRGHIQNYESYGLANVQWVALKHEKKWEYLFIHALTVLVLLIAYMHLSDMLILVLLIISAIILPVTYVLSYRTSLQVGLGNQVVKSSQRVTRDNRRRALRFLNHIERTAQKISHSKLRSKRKS